MRSLRDAAAPVRIERVERLHVGCGRTPLEGWLNVDLLPLEGVDRVLDVSDGLPFRDVSRLYAEHFLEHLSLQEGLAFLRGCRRVLAPAGVIRLSTPNLDWVMRTHYRPEDWSSPDKAVLDCLQTNRAFHGWGHQFLYNRQTLTLSLETAGFERVTFHRYGESERPELRGLERHEAYADEPDLPHVIIAEATGGAVRDAPNPEPFEIYRRDRDLKG